MKIVDQNAKKGRKSIEFGMIGIPTIVIAIWFFSENN